MNLFQKFKEKLSTSLKFVALLSIIFQLVVLLFLISKIYLEAIILCTYLFYFFIIVIGFSRYVEVKSKNIKEKIINFFLLLNCFPLIIGVLVLTIFFAMQTFPTNTETKEIDTEDVRFIVRDSNGNEVEKRGDEFKFDVKNGKIQDSIIQVKIKE